MQIIDQLASLSRYALLAVGAAGALALSTRIDVDAPPSATPTRPPEAYAAETWGSECGFSASLEAGTRGIRVNVEGTFEARAVPLRLRVGTEDVTELFIAPDGTAIAGWISRAPQPGDLLIISYADAAPFGVCALHDRRVI